MCSLMTCHVLAEGGAEAHDDRREDSFTSWCMHARFVEQHLPRSCGFPFRRAILIRIVASRASSPAADRERG